MPRPATLPSVLLLCLVVSSCGLLKGKKEPELVKGSEKSPDGPTYLVGLVEMVNPDQRFVLIRTEGKMTIPEGRELVALDATGAQSKLKVSPEKKQHFLTADITEGQPRVGNLVAYRPGKQGQPINGPSQPVAPGQPVAPDQPQAQPVVQQPPTPAVPSEFLTPAGLSSETPPAGARPSPIPPQSMPPAAVTPAAPLGGGQLTPTEQQVVLPPVVR